jgi:hypothetical protein
MRKIIMINLSGRFNESMLKEGKLIGSDVSLEGLKKGIAKYFYDNSADDITLKPNSDNTWDVMISELRLKISDLGKGRKRFEI